MAKELCKLKKLLKSDTRDYMRLVGSPTHLCTKCGRVANSKKLLCSSTRLKY